MALFTSIQTGNWSDAATWDVGGGAYPGSTNATLDTVLVSAGHTVTLDITTMPGTGQVGKTDIYGTVVIGANFQVANDFYTGGWNIESGGLLKFKNDAAGTYAIRLCRSNHLTIKSGGKLEMISNTDPAIKHRLYMDSEAVSNSANVYVESGGEVEIEGYNSRTSVTYLTADAANGQKLFFVADDTGWEVGDDVFFAERDTTYEGRTLTAEIVDLNWQVNSNLSYYHTQYCHIYNLSKNVELFCPNLARPSFLSLASGSIATVKQCQFTAFTLSNEEDQTDSFEGLTFYTRWGPQFNNKANGILKDSICAILDAKHTCVVASAAVTTSIPKTKIINCDLYSFSKTATESSCITSMGVCEVDNTSIMALTGIYSGKTGLSYLLEVKNSFIHSCAENGVNLIYASNSLFSNTIFGEDRWGHAKTNVQDFNSVGDAILDNCVFSGTTYEIGSPIAVGKSIKVLNYQQVSGDRQEYQKYGLLTTDTVDARSGNCYKIDPSSTVYPFILRLNIPCLSGKTPQVKFWAKKDNTLGNVDVSLGIPTCGLTDIKASSGSLDANKRFAPTDDYVQYTIDFNGPTTVSGEIEVLINILDSAAGIFYIDDITVSGNLT